MLKALLEGLFSKLHQYAAYIEVAILLAVISFGGYEYVKVQHLTADLAQSNANLQVAKSNILTLQASVQQQNTAIEQYKQAAASYQASMESVSNSIDQLRARDSIVITKVLKQDLGTTCPNAFKSLVDTAPSLGQWSDVK